MREAESLAQRLGDQQRLGRVWAHLAHCHWWLGDPDRAVEFGNLAHRSAVERRDNALDVLATARLAQAHFTLGEHTRVIELLGRHIESLGTETNEGVNVPGLGAVMYGLFTVLSLTSRGDHRQAKAVSERSYQIAVAADHPVSLAMATMGQGIAPLALGDFSEAIRQLEKGLEIVEEKNLDFQRAWTKGFLGHAYVQHGRVEQGIRLLRQTLEHDAAMNMMMIQPRDLIALSEAYHLAGRHAEAIEEAQHALDLIRVHRQRGWEAYALRVMGEIHGVGQSPDIGAAESYYRGANAIAEELEMRPLQAHCHLGLGKLAGLANNPAQAETHIKTAMELYQEMDMAYWFEQASAAAERWD